MHLNGPKGLTVVASSLALVAVLLTACGSTSAEVQVKTATPVSGETRSSETQSSETQSSETQTSKTVPSKTVPTSRTRPPSTENHPPGTAGQSPDTEAQHPDTEAPLPSIDKQADAQALIDEVPKLVGDPDLQAMLSELAADTGIIPPDDEDDSEDPAEFADQWNILVTCTGEKEQVKLLRELTESGHRCRALIA